jgi:hypothetical protein
VDNPTKVKTPYMKYPHLKQTAKRMLTDRDLEMKAKIRKIGEKYES